MPKDQRPVSVLQTLLIQGQKLRQMKAKHGARLSPQTKAKLDVAIEKNETVCRKMQDGQRQIQDGRHRAAKK